MMKITGDYVPVHIEPISRAALPNGGLITFGTLPEPPAYALTITYPHAPITGYRGPASQIVDKYRAELRKRS